MPRISRLSSAFLATLLASAAVAQEQGVFVTHQGRLLDSTDSPVNATVTLTVSLYALHEPAPGAPETPLWSETLSDVKVVDGFYAVVLGQGGSGPLPAAEFAPGQERWLGVRIDDGLELRPRLRFGAVVRALSAGRADDSARLEGRTLADLDGRWVRLDDGTTAPQTGDLLLDGGIQAKSVAADTLSGDVAGLTGVLGSAIAYEGQPIEDDYVAGASRWSAKLDEVSVEAPLSGKGTANDPLTVPTANSERDGVLQASDWTRFDAKIGPDDPRLTDARVPTSGSAHYIHNHAGGTPQVASISINGDVRAGLVKQTQRYHYFAHYPQDFDVVDNSPHKPPTVLENVGNMYDPTTGEITIPVDGVYSLGASYAHHRIADSGANTHIILQCGNRSYLLGRQGWVGNVVTDDQRNISGHVELHLTAGTKCHYRGWHQARPYRIRNIGSGVITSYITGTLIAATP